MTTAGFNTVPLSALSAGALMVLMALMSVGGSPSGTGGGIKTTAATCLLAIVSSHLQGRKQITFLGKEIPTYRLYIATSSFIFYIFPAVCNAVFAGVDGKPAVFGFAV